MGVRIGEASNPGPGLPDGAVVIGSWANRASAPQIPTYEAPSAVTPLDPDQIRETTWSNAEIGFRLPAPCVAERPRARTAVEPTVAPCCEGLGFVEASAYAGAVSGYAFKVGPSGLGYYHDVAGSGHVAGGPAATTIQLANLIPPPASADDDERHPGPTTRTAQRARRARHPDGKRKKRLPRTKGLAALALPLAQSVLVA